MAGGAHDHDAWRPSRNARAAAGGGAAGLPRRRSRRAARGGGGAALCGDDVLGLGLREPLQHHARRDERRRRALHEHRRRPANNASSAPLYSMPGGVRDPSLLRWRGRWFVVLSFAQNKSSSLFLASSADLRHWEPLGADGGGCSRRCHETILLTSRSSSWGRTGTCTPSPTWMVRNGGSRSTYATALRRPPQRVGRRCELVRPSAAAGYAGRGARARQ
eukprot:COSAG06_NODE_1977_length_7932_cov_59.287374_1_plen_219_part_00